MNRIAAAILAAAFLAGCASPQDWRYFEVKSAIDDFRKAGPPTAAMLPHRVRSIRIDGADSLTVYLSDDPGLMGHGCELKLKRLSSGTWVVAGSRFFDY